MIKLNEQKLTEAEFKEEKKKLEAKPGVRVIKISENVYRTEIRG